MSAPKPPGPPSNPMMVEVILRTLFDYLPVDSLATARLVCRLWNKLSSQNFQNKMLAADKTMVLTQENWNDFAGTFDTRESVFFWTKLVLRSVPLKQMYPKNLFSNYGAKITHFSLLENSADTITLENFREVFTCLKSVSVLCLGSLPSDISACVEKLFPEGKGHVLPKLKKIQLHLKSRAYSYNFFQGLFSTTPTLERLTIRDTRSEFDLINLVLDVLSHQIRTIKSLKIAELNECNLHLLNTYSLQGMKLEKLSLESLSHEVTHATVFELLSWQAATLKSLVIGRPSACRSVFINFTFPFVMPNLTVLDFWTHSLEWGGIHYSRQLPMLQKIVVRAYKSFHNWPIPLPDPRNIHPENRCTTVNTIVYVDEQFSTDNQVNIWKLYLLFPHISRVCVDINDIRTFQTFWTFWSSLEDLEIHLDRRCLVPDVAFTGFQRVAIKDALNLQPENIFPVVQDLVKESKALDGIARLPRLKRLFVNVKSSGLSVSEPYHEISDVAAYYMVLKLPELEELTINSSRISSYCLTTLRQMPKMKRLNVKSVLI